MANSSLTGDLRRRILQAAHIEALVEDRVHLTILPEPAKYPAVVLTLVSTAPVSGLSGYHKMRFRRIQIDSYATDADECMALGEAVFDALEGVSGVLGSVTAGHVRLLSERDFFEPEVECFRRSQDWEIAEITQ